MDKIRVGIIGMGRMGITHYSIINTHPNVEMTALADTSGILLNMVKRYLPGVKMFDDYKALLKSGLVDAVIVSTPSVMHYEVCLMAAEQGIHVFCEKPFTTHPDQARRLADLFGERGLVNQVGYVYRFDSVFGRVRDMLAEGLIGQVCHVNAEFLSSTLSKQQPEKGWRSRRESGGGATYEMGSHVIDLLEFFLGRPQQILGSMMNQVYSENVEDISEVQLRYAGGVTAHVHVNWSDYTYRKPMLKLDIHGRKGKIQADLYGYRLFLREPNPEAGLPEGWTSVPMNLIPDSCPFYVRGASFTNQLYEFADAVLHHRQSRGCPFRQAVDTQEVIHHIFEHNT